MKLYIKQKVFSLTDTFVIKDANENDYYIGRRKFFSFGANIDVYNRNDDIVANIQQKLFSLLPQYDINISNGESFTVVKKFDFFKSDFIFKGIDLSIEGDFFSHNFTLYNGNQEIMTVSKQWLSWGDTYELDIVSDENEILCICAVIVIDMVLHNDSNNS
jgi:uncharacterized protein YxjI